MSFNFAGSLTYTQSDTSPVVGTSACQAITTDSEVSLDHLRQAVGEVDTDCGSPISWPKKYFSLRPQAKEIALRHQQRSQPIISQSFELLKTYFLTFPQQSAQPEVQMLPHDRAITILGALLILWFSRFTESTHPALIKRVSDPSAIPPPPPAPVVKTNIHCGDEFASYKPNDPLLRSCTDYGLVKYSCDTSQCHAGEQGDDAHSGSRIHKLGDRGKMTYLVYAISYLARNKKGYLIAIGFAVGDPLEMVTT
ncbi:hypothetical protein H4Q26_006833 [Puccinia striiformis f. sp. tritici PST-130]|nr:hypothetical protein H4Q26_006833 [Puccinia striiformis f. sp. tritici PST-130]